MQSSDEQTNHATRSLDLNTQKGDNEMVVATRTRLGQLQFVVAISTTRADPGWHRRKAPWKSVHQPLVVEWFNARG